MKVDVFDERICSLGEGPCAVGFINADVSWVDIEGSKVLTRNLITEVSDQFSTNENVGFAIPRTLGGYVLGTNNGPIFRNADGTQTPFLRLSDLEPLTSQMAIRWNDAKVSPSGNLWFGTMGYEMMRGTSSLFKYDVKRLTTTKILTDLTISNGMDWSDDGGTFYFIDSVRQGVNAFTVNNDELSEERMVIEIAQDEGAPDGMCMDSDGGLWVALWGGSQLRRYDTRDHYKLSQVIKLPAAFVTSCAFAGENLETLIITSAQNGQADGSKESGMTFCMTPGVTGRPCRTFDL